MALIGDVIYMSEVYGAFRDMMKITMTKTVTLEASSLDLNKHTLRKGKDKWSFELSKVCPEFE